jgi:hypothetical protein
VSHVKIEFETENDAFRQPSGDLDIAEVERVIKTAEARVWAFPAGGTMVLRDLNGNRVGLMTIEEDY